MGGAACFTPGSDRRILLLLGDPDAGALVSAAALCLIEQQAKQKLARLVVRRQTLDNTEGHRELEALLRLWLVGLAGLGGLGVVELPPQGPPGLLLVKSSLEQLQL